MAGTAGTSAGTQPGTRSLRAPRQLRPLRSVLPRAVPPLPAGGPAAHLWHCCLQRTGPEEEVGSAGRAGSPQLWEQPTWHSSPRTHGQDRANRSKCPTCAVCSPPCSMPEHTTPWQQLPWALASPTQGSAETSFQGMQTEFYFLKRIDLEISLELGNTGHHLMKSVWGWSSTIFLRLLLKRPLPDTRITSETSRTVIKNQNQPNRNHCATAAFTPTWTD